MEDNSRIEFYISPSGKVMVNEEGVSEQREYTIENHRLSKRMLRCIEVQYPQALEALNELYAGCKLNRAYYDYIRVHRFIRCNFGKFDGLTYDVEGDMMHIEEVSCPMRFECKMNGIVCKPKPFGLTEREASIARMAASGRSYKEISCILGISHSTIKNFLQRIKKRLKLRSSKDIVKMFTTVI